MLALSQAALILRIQMLPIVCCLLLNMGDHSLSPTDKEDVAALPSPAKRMNAPTAYTTAKSRRLKLRVLTWNRYRSGERRIHDE